MIQPNFTARGLAKYFDKLDRRIDAVIIRELKLLGEKCVNICRDLDTYQDDTGNLRSGIAYELYVNRVPYAENFKAVPGKGSSGGEIGVSNARIEISLLAETILDSYYQLIIVSGMDYSEEVEAKNYAVLTPAEQFAENEIPKIRARILRSISKAA